MPEFGLELARGLRRALRPLTSDPTTLVYTKHAPWVDSPTAVVIAASITGTVALIALLAGWLQHGAQLKAAEERQKADVAAENTRHAATLAHDRDMRWRDDLRPVLAATAAVLLGVPPLRWTGFG